jgi:hypothetical protein
LSGKFSANKADRCESRLLDCREAGLQGCSWALARRHVRNKYGSRLLVPRLHYCREKCLFRAFAHRVSQHHIRKRLTGQSVGAPNVYFATQTIRFNTPSGPYDYIPGSRFVLVRPDGADLLVQSLDTQVQMVVAPSWITNDVEVANQAWRSWMQANGLLEQFDREIAQRLAEQKAEQEAAAQRQAEQQAAWQRHGDPYSFVEIVDAPAEPARTAL